jgi:hypothetical protein
LTHNAILLKTDVPMDRPQGEKMLSILVNGKDVIVGEYQTVGSLAGEFGSGRYLFVHNGSSMCPAMSFAFYGVSEGDEIALLRGRGSRRRSRRPWIVAGAPEDSMCFEHVREAKKLTEQAHPKKIVDGGPAVEAARVSDLFRMKIESNVSTYRKVCAQYLRLVNSRDVAHYDRVTVIPEEAVAPSTEFLPPLSTQASSVVKADNMSKNGFM